MVTGHNTKDLPQFCSNDVDGRKSVVRHQPFLWSWRLAADSARRLRAAAGGRVAPKFK